MSEKEGKIDLSVWKDKKAIIADDSTLVRQAHRELLTSLGIQVIAEAKDGLEVLEKLKLQKPDIIFLDIIMPNMHGIECYRQIKKNNKDLAIFLVTSLGSGKRLETPFGEEIPEAHILEKPISTLSLQKALKALL